ncbi:MAG TPA: ribonuclease P protein component [Variovorax sp.]|nr:ribonuclease P protein component [Variovorax sp.]
MHRCALDAPARAGEGSVASLFEPPAVWLGAMVPKRWARRAVTRNAIKRQIYNVSASFEALLPQAAYVVRLRSGFDRTAFPSASSVALKSAVRAELIQLFERLKSRQGAAS